MKKVRIAIFTVLVLAVVALAFKIYEYEEIVTQKNDKIQKYSEQLLNLELENKDKDEYISELHKSVEALSADLTTLENKLQELSIAKDKLK